MSEVIVCTPKTLPPERQVHAAQRALEINPANHPPTAAVARSFGGGAPTGRERISLLVARRWPASGVRLTVGFLDNPPADLRAHILLHMNGWGKTANVAFVESNSNPKVRIARLNSPPDRAGYWSWLGTEILDIPDTEPTLNLEGFTMNTPESEFHRVVRHETGHTLGFPHEHMRRELVDRIDPAKAIDYFGLTQGWSAQEVKDQVLTPLDETSLIGTAHSDQHSIMCYQIPGKLTRDGKPIIGGSHIDHRDYAFAAACYPKALHQ